MDAQLTRLSRICLALPGTSREDCGRQARFVPIRRTCAWFLDDHHGDGIVGASDQVLPGDNAALVTAGPSKFNMPAYVTSRGWVGLRLDTRSLDAGGQFRGRLRR